MREDGVWLQQDVPVTVHVFVQNEDSTLSQPCVKRQCNEGGKSDGCLGPNASSCLSFYVRMADHPGKFNLDAAKAFALAIP